MHLEERRVFRQAVSELGQTVVGASTTGSCTAEHCLHGSCVRYLVGRWNTISAGR